MAVTVLNHLHTELQVAANQVVQVMLAGDAANVLLLDDDNYRRYCDGEEFHFSAGGHATRSPVVLRPPAPGRWHLVVDLAGQPGQVRAGVTVRPG